MINQMKKDLKSFRNSTNVSEECTPQVTAREVVVE